VFNKEQLAKLEKELLAQNGNHKDWECTEELMKLTKEGKALYMHCLPADITGVSCEAGEVEASVFDRYREPLYKEAGFKPYIIAAMMFLSKVKDPKELLEKLEELGIGRPSTYAPTIQTIQNREYVDKREIEPKEREIVKLTLTKTGLKKEILTEKFGGDKNKFVPTDIGIVVNDFLTTNFNEILDYGFTAKVEEDFDEIARGEEKWKDVLKNFYSSFHPKIEDVGENADRATGERLLGQDPKTGKNVYARIGRFGPMVQIGETDSDEKPIFASLMATQNIVTITLEEALELFKVPFDLQDYE